MKARVISRLNKRLWPSTKNTPLPNPLNPNDLIEVIEEVDGEAVIPTNKKWYKTNKGFYVWSGGTRNEVANEQAQILEAFDWWHKEFNINHIWNNLGKGEGIKVAILDSGIDASHPYFKASRITSGNIWDSTKEATDNWGHGTQVASILIANGPKYIGIAPQTEIQAIKIFNRDGASIDDLVKGISMINEDTDIVCISQTLSSLDNITDRDKLVNAFNRIKTKVIVCAAGNSSSRVSYEENLPAALSISISVSATQEGGSISPNSSLSKNITVAAPGHNVKCLLPNRLDYFGPDSGTSFSAPFISGLIALGLSYLKKKGKQPPTFNAIRQIIKKSAEIQPEKDLYGSGIINTTKFLNQILSL